MDALGFPRAIVDAYYHLYRKSLLSTTLFAGSRSLHKPANNLQFDGIHHWIAKDSQFSLPGCKGTSLYYCKKSNVGFHAKCFELYYCKESSLYGALKIKKRKLYTKKRFSVFLSLSIHNSSKISSDQINIFLIKK